MVLIVGNELQTTDRMDVFIIISLEGVKQVQYTACEKADKLMKRVEICLKGKSRLHYNHFESVRRTNKTSGDQI